MWLVADSLEGTSGNAKGNPRSFPDFGGGDTPFPPARLKGAFAWQATPHEADPIHLNRRSDRLSIERPERRRGRRIRQARAIQIFDPSVGRYVGGHTTDISSTGLRIRLPLAASVRPGLLVNVCIAHHDCNETISHRPAMVPARVVWVTKPRRSGLNAADSAESIHRMRKHGRGMQLAAGRIVAGVEFISNAAAHLDAA